MMADMRHSCLHARSHLSLSLYCFIFPGCLWADPAPALYCSVSDWFSHAHSLLVQHKLKSSTNIPPVYSYIFTLRHLYTQECHTWGAQLGIWDNYQKQQHSVSLLWWIMSPSLNLVITCRKYFLESEQDTSHKTKTSKLKMSLFNDVYHTSHLSHTA